jgi:SAM-dependent methyltransferase
MSRDESIDADWYAAAFGDLYPVVYAHRTVEAAAPECRFAAKTLDLKQDDRVLDLCCGTGRHLVHLARHATGLVGLDYSEDLLRRATTLLEGRAKLVRADMRSVPFANTFDVLTNFFTSFGYFMDDRENDRSVGSMANALRKGGRFFVDLINPAHTRANLVPQSSRMRDDFRIDETRWIDETARRVNKITQVSQHGHTIAEFQESVRLYEERELLEMFGVEGLAIDHVYGDYDGCDAADNHPRLILTGHKV